MNTEKIISYGIGRRKQAIAQVILKLGNGTLTINNKSGDTYLQNNTTYLQRINNPFILTKRWKKTRKQLPLCY